MIGKVLKSFLFNVATSSRTHCRDLPLAAPIRVYEGGNRVMCTAKRIMSAVVVSHLLSLELFRLRNVGVATISRRGAGSIRQRRTRAFRRCIGSCGPVPQIVRIPADQLSS